MAKQRLNSAGWTVMILGCVLVFSIIAAMASIIVVLNQGDQIESLTSIAEDTQDLLKARIAQNEENVRRQRDAEKAVSEAIGQIQLNTALSVDCAYLRRLGIRPDQCHDVNERIDTLKDNDTITITVPSTTTTTTIVARSRAPAPIPTTTRVTAVPTTLPPPTTTTTPPCRGITLLGLCIGG